MTQISTEVAGLEPIGPSQRMIGLLLAQPGEDGAPLFTHESLASRLLEEEGADQVGTKALGELLRRTQRGEMERSRPLPYLYKIFAEEMTDEVISPWYGAASDALERSFLLQDMAGVDLLAGIIRTLPQSGRHVADDAYHWMLQGRVKQLLGQELGTAGQFFARAQIGFNKAISKVGATPYLRYMRLLAMEARLNVEYKLTKNSGANMWRWSTSCLISACKQTFAGRWNRSHQLPGVHIFSLKPWRLSPQRPLLGH